MTLILSEEFKIEVPGGKVYAKKWTPEKIASDVPVVMLHDSLGSVDLWRGFPQTLAADISRTIIAYDRLGFGKSDARDKLPPLDFIEEEAAIYFPHIKTGLGISKYILFGHSVGGGMSINIAARDRDCAGVITAASQAFVEDLTIKGIEDAKKAFQQPGQIERLEKWHGGKARWVLDAWIKLWTAPEFSGWSLESCNGKILCPVLAIHGDRDEYGSLAFPEFITRVAGKDSKMLILQDCGHMPHHEKTSEVLNAIKEFLSVHAL